MARLFIDGFESGSLDLWDTITGGVTASTTQKKTGAYAMYTGTSGIYVTKNLPSAIRTIYTKFWWRSYSSIVEETIATWSDDVGVQVSLQLRSSGYLTLTRGMKAGTILGTGTTAISTSTWYLIEVHLYIDSTSGIAELKLNNTTPLEIDFDGNTQNQTGNTMTKTAIGQQEAASAMNQYFDDYGLDDANWLGDTRIQKLQPTGAGASTGWTPSTPPNWHAVDEIPAVDSDYVVTNSNDILDTYEASNLTGAVTTIKCVQIQARAVKEGASTPQNLKLAVRSNDADYVSANKAVSASFKSLFNIWEKDPGRSDADWTVDNVNALEIGMKSAA